jgi:hypothetical protein
MSDTRDLAPVVSKVFTVPLFRCFAPQIKAPASESGRYTGVRSAFRCRGTAHCCCPACPGRSASCRATLPIGRTGPPSALNYPGGHFHLHRPVPVSTRIPPPLAHPQTTLLRSDWRPFRHPGLRLAERHLPRLDHTRRSPLAHGHAAKRRRPLPLFRDKLISQSEKSVNQRISRLFEVCRDVACPARRQRMHNRIRKP